MSKTERLVIKIWRDDKAELRRIADFEGESLAVVARKALRLGMRELRKSAIRPTPTQPVELAESAHAYPHALTPSG